MVRRRTLVRAQYAVLNAPYAHATLAMPMLFARLRAAPHLRESIDITYATLDTGHCANFTAAKLVANIVERVDARELHDNLKSVDTATSKEDVRDAIMSVVESK
jgi:hypothetical protein